MRPVSDRFLASLRESHLISSSCTLHFPDGTTHAVPVEGGSVVIDRTAQARRSGSVVIPWSLRDETDLGLDLRSLPLGGYASVSRGLRYADGTTEEALLGFLRVESVTWATLETSATLELSDRMAQVRDESFTFPFAAGGLSIATAAITIVQGVFGDITVHDLTDSTPTLADVFYSGSRAEALSALASAAAAEAYFDADGSFVFAPSSGLDEPVWSVDAGARGVMIDASEALDRTGVYNGVIVIGQDDGTTPPITALATFDDATSPLRWDGPFGKVAVVVTNSSAQTVEQAQAVAESLLSLRLQQTRQLTLQAAPNPALEAGDAISVVFPDGRDELHLIDSVTCDLGTGAQSIQTRSREVPGAASLLAGAAAWREASGARLA